MEIMWRIIPRGNDNVGWMGLEEWMSCSRSARFVNVQVYQFLFLSKDGGPLIDLPCSWHLMSKLGNVKEMMASVICITFRFILRSTHK